MGIKRYLGPRRSSCTLIRECLVDTHLNVRMVVTQYLGTTGLRVPREIETRILISHVPCPLSGAELSWSIIVRARKQEKARGGVTFADGSPEAQAWGGWSGAGGYA